MEIVAETWIKNNIYHLKFSDRDILLRVTDWLNDSVMDAAQNLFANHWVAATVYAPILGT